MKKKFKQRKQHWFLFSYKFSTKDHKDGYGSATTPKNSMNIPTSNFNRIKEWAKESDNNIDKIIITSVSYLGYMTEKEFYDEPTN